HGARVDREIHLNRIVTLDSVVTKASRGVTNEFEENRRLGLGHFFTRAELANQEGRTLSAVLATTPGLGLVRGRSSAWILSTRAPASIARRGEATVCTVRRVDECRQRD